MEDRMKIQEIRKERAVPTVLRMPLTSDRIKQVIAQHRPALEELAQADGAVLGAKSTSAKRLNVQR